VETKKASYLMESVPGKPTRRGDDITIPSLSRLTTAPPYTYRRCCGRQALRSPLPSPPSPGDSDISATPYSLKRLIPTHPEVGNKMKQYLSWHITKLSISVSGERGAREGVPGSTGGVDLAAQPSINNSSSSDADTHERFQILRIMMLGQINPRG
jgi:hypothetical protein